MDSEMYSLLEKQVHEWNRPDGLNMIDLLEMADPLRKVLNWIVRQDQVTLEQLKGYLLQDMDKIELLVDNMTRNNILAQVIQNNTTLIKLNLTIRSRKLPNTKSILDDL